MSSYDYFMSELEVLQASASLKFDKLYKDYKGRYDIADFMAILSLLEKSKSGELHRLVQDIQAIKWELGDDFPSLDIAQVVKIILQRIKDDRVSKDTSRAKSTKNAI